MLPADAEKEFAGSQPTLKEAAAAKNYLNGKELCAMGQLMPAYPASCKLLAQAEKHTSIDPDDKHYSKRKADLDDRRYKIYDKSENTEKWQLMAGGRRRLQFPLHPGGGQPAGGAVPGGAGEDPLGPGPPPHDPHRPHRLDGGPGLRLCPPGGALFPFGKRVHDPSAPYDAYDESDDTEEKAKSRLLPPVRQERGGRA